MVKSKIYSAKKISYQPNSFTKPSLFKSRKKAKLFFRKPVLKTSWKNAITPLLLFLALFISLYIAVLIGARIAYFTSFSAYNQSAWTGAIPEHGSSSQSMTSLNT
ncbi:hypothetical protein [uncultured Shewanella sp.]|uniref:hypothetical protein n=1 Tax=uncultured Shewanella sp. TaxID=173975 RepID=UPI00261A76C6|nr:hypothetical protein [uncultured Shewanella sp.]